MRPYALTRYSGALYHGSPKRVSSFRVDRDARSGKFGEGLYLTPDVNTALFYSQGGRQGGPRSILGNAGVIYGFKVSGRCLKVFDLFETLANMVGEYEPASEAFARVGDLDSPLVSKCLAGWAEELGADLIELSKEEDLLPQVLVINQAAIKSYREMPLEKITSALYQGREVKLNQPYRSPKGSSKKFYVYVKDGDKVVKVSFGDPNMEIRRDNPKARDNFRSRHNCDSKKDKTSPGYWSCKMWEGDTSVTEVLSAIDLPEWSPKAVHERLVEIPDLANGLLPGGVFFHPTWEREDDVPVLRILIGCGDPYTAERAGSFAFYSTVRGLEWYAKQVGKLPPFEPGKGQVWVTLVDDADPQEQPVGVLRLQETPEAWAETLVSWLT